MAFNSPLAVCRALGGPFEQGRVSDIAKCIHWADEIGSEVDYRPVETDGAAQAAARIAELL